MPHLIHYIFIVKIKQQFMFKHSSNIIKIILNIITLIFICNIYLVYAQDKIVELEPIFSFGQNGNEILTSAKKIATDYNNSIFIADQISSRIFEYNMDGDFVRIIGGKGRGPGEYIYPATLETNGKVLFVPDPSNKRFISFNLRNDSSYIVNRKRTLIEFDVYKNKIYGFNPPGLRINTSSFNENLLTVIDFNGKKVSSFGKYLAPFEGTPAGMSWPYIKIENDIVHVAFTYFPIYRAYSLDGKLLFEVNLSEISNINDNITNYNKDQLRGNNSTGLSAVIRAMDVQGNKIFICRQGRTILIDEFEIIDNTLILKKTHMYTDLPPEYYVIDFFFHDKSNSFYILEKNIVPKVTVYKTAEN